MRHAKSVRIGVVGAGKVFREKHLPRLAGMEGVEVITICNRTSGSAQAIARMFGVSSVEEDWTKVVRRDDLDAIMIGTWPNSHADIAIAALEAGRHVFCQSPMAVSAPDARRMADSALRHPCCVSVVCACEMRSRYDDVVKSVLGSERLGRITAVDVISTSRASVESEMISWREREDVVGLHLETLDAYAEVLNSWVGPYKSISAATATPIESKRDETGESVAIRVPQVVMVLGLLESGAVGVEYHGTVTTDVSTPRNLVTIYGLNGTLRCNFGSGSILMGGAGNELRDVPLPDPQQGWSLEADFVEAVWCAKAGSPWRYGSNLSFAEGLPVVQKIDAIRTAATTGCATSPAGA